MKIISNNIIIGLKKAKTKTPFLRTGFRRLPWKIRKAGAAPENRPEQTRQAEAGWTTSPPTQEHPVDKLPGKAPSLIPKKCIAIPNFSRRWQHRLKSRPARNKFAAEWVVCQDEVKICGREAPQSC